MLACLVQQGSVGLVHVGFTNRFLLMGYLETSSPQYDDRNWRWIWFWSKSPNRTINQVQSGSNFLSGLLWLLFWQSSPYVRSWVVEWYYFETPDGNMLETLPLALRRSQKVQPRSVRIIRLQWAGKPPKWARGAASGPREGNLPLNVPVRPVFRAPHAAQYANWS